MQNRELREVGKREPERKAYMANEPVSKKPEVSQKNYTAGNCKAENISDININILILVVCLKSP